MPREGSQRHDKWTQIFHGNASGKEREFSWKKVRSMEKKQSDFLRLKMSMWGVKIEPEMNANFSAGECVEGEKIFKNNECKNERGKVHAGIKKGRKYRRGYASSKCRRKSIREDVSAF